MDGELSSVPAVSGVIVAITDGLRMAIAAHLARFKGQSRIDTEPDLRAYTSWCGLHDLDPLAAKRPHVELYVRWLQEVRGFKASTVVQQMLGHASATMTLDTYGHFFEDRLDDVASAMDAARRSRPGAPQRPGSVARCCPSGARAEFETK